MASGKIQVIPGEEPQGGKTSKVVIGVREDRDGYWLIIGSRKIKAGWKPWFIAVRDYVLEFQRFNVEYDDVHVVGKLEHYGWARWLFNVIDSEYPIPRYVMSEINEEIDRVRRTRVVGNE